MKTSELNSIQPLEESSAIREIIDPQGTLPYVEFHQVDRHVDDEEPFIDVDRYDIVNASQEHIGDNLLATVLPFNTQFFAWIHIKAEPELRGKGYGLASYILAIEHAHEHGYDFSTGTINSIYSKRVWDRLVVSGVARVVRPFEFYENISDEDGKIEPTYKGDVRVLQP
jgi:hypothetical protein